MKHHDLTPHDVDPGTLTLHPENPNHGDEDAIADSITINGFFEPVAVQKSTGYIVSGNHRTKVARRLGLDTIPVVYLDLTDTEARTILLSANSTGQKAVMDDLGIGRILQAIQDDTGNLSGTGYEIEEMEDFMLMVQAVEAENARYADNEQPDEPVSTGFAPPKATPGIKVPGTDDPDYTPHEPVTEAREHPTNPSRRLVILDLPLDVYAWLSDRLTELAEEYGTTHHTTTILATIAEATGTTPPDFHGPIVSDPDTDGIPQE